MQVRAQLGEVLLVIEIHDRYFNHDLGIGPDDDLPGSLRIFIAGNRECDRYLLAIQLLEKRVTLCIGHIDRHRSSHRRGSIGEVIRPVREPVTIDVSIGTVGSSITVNIRIDLIPNSVTIEILVHSIGDAIRITIGGWLRQRR